MGFNLLDGFKKTTTAFKTAYGNKRVAIMAPLGFSSGLPYLLTGSTLAAWMATEEIDIKTIGLFGLVNLPHNLKLLWAPLFDRFNLPWLSRRRDWMVVSQLALITSIFLLGNCDPAQNLPKVLLFTFILSACSTSQDIVTDAYRVDILRETERASGLAIFVALYRAAMIVSSGGALILAEFVEWQVVYKILAGLMLIGVIATIFAPKTEEKTEALTSLKDAIVLPWLDFFKRPNAILFLIILMTYKVGDFVASTMMMPFLLELEFEKAAIGSIYSVLGLSMTILGCLVGGGLVNRYGLKKSLLLFGILQAGANSLYIVLAAVGKSYTVFILTIGVDQLFGGMGTAAFGALLMSLCNKRFSAAQFALLSSATTIVGRVLGGSSGFIATATGWPFFFGLSLVAALPALFLITMVKIDSHEVSR